MVRGTIYNWIEHAKSSIMAIIYRQFTHPQKMNREERKKTNDLYIFFCEINLRTKLLWV